MKILFFIEGLGAGGAERRLVELIKGISNYPNIEIELVSTKNNLHYNDLLSTGIRIHYLIRKKLKKDPIIFLKFFKIAKKFRPDIIHVWGNLTAFYAIPTKVLLSTPMINNQITNAPLEVSRSIFGHSTTFPFSDVIISNTIAGLKVYRAPMRKSKVIYNGFNFDRIIDLEDEKLIRRKFNIQSEFIIGMVGHFSDKKDYTTYIKAAKKVLIKNSNVTFLCIGGGDFGKYDQIVGHEYRDNILFLGRQDQVESIMNVCDIGVLVSNSKVHGEGISNALLEFMALGKPVIANDAGGTKELIMDKENGFLIKDEDIHNLAEKISFLLNNKTSRKEFGNASIQIVKEKFNIQKMIDNFMQEYVSIFDKNKIDHA